METSKPKKSGSAIFMDCVMALTVVISILCFILYYGNFFPSEAVLWTGIVCFTILYHFWLRIFLGNVSKKFKLHYRQRWFRELPFEKKFYAFLKVKRWKDKALTYDPAAFDLRNHSLEELAVTMCKSEVDHWMNQVISLSTILFSIFWGMAWLFALTAVLAMLFDGQFILIQRYNRPRVLRLLQRMEAVR